MSGICVKHVSLLFGKYLTWRRCFMLSVLLFFPSSNYLSPGALRIRFVFPPPPPFLFLLLVTAPFELEGLVVNYCGTDCVASALGVKGLS